MLLIRKKVRVRGKEGPILPLQPEREVFLVENQKERQKKSGRVNITKGRKEDKIHSKVAASEVRKEKTKIERAANAYYKVT